ncbi:hypothetical protein [Mucilaginibacter aquatilis]|uniref:Uncharacterized protein n=1 Tax=Mucilaginibacter aquatilis TaxID=1517760 RepID=A0A6I4IHI3_9SPHI|nr:hypothetical protein [Mucilaginibacter aquatilis]MVN92966.1 hypothetical protein [Mucilaginibacter aquatilis]
MSEQKGSMAPGQQNYPSENEPQGNPHALSGDEIREGANEEDQLDELKENSTNVDDNKKSGAAPTAYQNERKITDDQ